MLKRVLFFLLGAYLVAGLPVAAMGFIITACAGASDLDIILFTLLSWVAWPLIITGAFC